MKQDANSQCEVVPRVLDLYLGDPYSDPHFHDVSRVTLGQSDTLSITRLLVLL